MSKWMIALLSFCGALVGQTASWPTYAADSARSASTEASLPRDLALAWTWRSRGAPALAWPGPAKWDGYNKVTDLKDRMTFDAAFQPIAVGDRVWFGSSVDDKIYCLDARTGNELWSVFTEGPVRLSPTWSDGRLYVGSDDGFVYCLNADTGEEIWRQRPGPRDHRVPGNGRLISLWAVRTGVVVKDGVAYCCAGIFPTHGVYLCAFDALTGEVRFKTVMDDLPAQGYLLASEERLYVTTGRERPVVFDRSTGRRLFQVSGGGGGTYALLTGDTFVYGPGITGAMATHAADGKDQIAAFDGNHMIVAGGTAWLHGDAHLSSLDRAQWITLEGELRTRAAERKTVAERLKKLGKSGVEDEVKSLRGELSRLGEAIDLLHARQRACETWKVPCAQPHSLIRAGEALVVGGRDDVAMVSTKNGELLWQSAVEGRAFGLAAAEGRLLVSTDRGVIHCFSAKSKGAGR